MLPRPRSCQDFLVAFGCLVTIMACSPENQTAAPRVDQYQLRADVAALCAITPARNYRNIDSLNRAADHILFRFRDLGFAPHEQLFSAYQHEYKNIIASHGPAGVPRLVVGAHYDVCEDQPGADDNGSGVAALLALAGLFRQHALQLPFRIDFVAFALEEPPTFRSKQMGSFVHAKSLHDARVPVLGMISLEMVGFYSNLPNSQNYPLPVMKLFYPDTANFIALVGNLGSRKLVNHFYKYMRHGGIEVQRLVAPPFIPGIDFSDHLNYWKFDYPALMVTDTSFYRNPHYHQPSDTIDTLDFDKMAELVRGLYQAIRKLSGPRSPRATKAMTGTN